MAEEKKEQVKLQKKDLVKHWLLGYSSETCYNYERLQALGTTNAMVPIVRRLYKTKEEQAKVLLTIAIENACAVLSNSDD